MNAWLWILQFEPMTAPRCTSTNGPILVLSPIRHPYRFVNAWTTTCSPNSTSDSSRYGASLTGPSATREPRAHLGDDPFHLALRDPREDRERQAFPCEPLGNGERSFRVAQLPVRGGKVRRLGVVASGADVGRGEVRGEVVPVGGAHDEQ